MSLNFSNNAFSKNQKLVALSVIKESLKHSNDQIKIAKSVLKEISELESQKNDNLLKIKLSSYVNSMLKEMSGKGLTSMEEFFKKMSEIGKIEINDKNFNRNKLYYAAELLVHVGKSLNLIAKQFVKKSSIPPEKIIGELQEFQNQKESLKTIFQIDSSNDSKFSSFIKESGFDGQKFIEDISKLEKKDFVLTEKDKN